MAWRDQLRDGAFRGAAFQINSAEYEFGRRTEVNEYPLSEAAPYAEDLGLAPDVFSLDCYVIGDDYMTARDALIKAVRTPGSGTLVHPYYGTITVSVSRPARVRESTAEGGMATFSLEFVRAGDNLFPAATADTQGQSADQATATASTAQDSFASTFDVSGEPDFVSTSATSLLDQALGDVGDLAVPLNLGDQLLALFRAQLAGFGASLPDQVGQPDVLAASMATMIASAASLAPSPAAAFTAFRPLAAFGSTLPAIMQTTPARVRQAANQAAIVQLVGMLAAGQLVAAVAGMTFVSYEDAISARDVTADAIDALATVAGDAGGDDAYSALQDLRLALVRDVTARGGSLARLFSLTPVADIPSLVLAHQLYGDPTREAEIVSRNHIANPLFVPGGVVLELLTPQAANG